LLNRLIEIASASETMKSKVTPQTIENLRVDLNQVRQASLSASRNNDFMRVGRLTSKAAQINKSIMDAQGQLDAEL
jgi:hypothetical protein